MEFIKRVAKKSVDQRISKTEPSTWVTSHVMSTRNLIIFRFSIFLYTLAILILSWQQSKNPQIYLFFLTNLSWISIVIFFLLGSIFTFQFYKNDHNAQVIADKPTWFKWILWNLYASQITLQVMVVGVFWVVLAGPLFKKNPPGPLEYFVCFY